LNFVAFAIQNILRVAVWLVFLVVTYVRHVSLKSHQMLPFFGWARQCTLIAQYWVVPGTNLGMINLRYLFHTQSYQIQFYKIKQYKNSIELIYRLLYHSCTLII